MPAEETCTTACRLTVTDAVNFNTTDGMTLNCLPQQMPESRVKQSYFLQMQGVKNVVLLFLPAFCFNLNLPETAKTLPPNILIKTRAP